MNGHYMNDIVSGHDNVLLEQIQKRIPIGSLVYYAPDFMYGTVYSYHMASAGVCAVILCSNGTPYLVESSGLIKMCGQHRYFNK